MRSTQQFETRIIVGEITVAMPHIHCVVPAGGLALDRSHWVSARSDFFLPIPVLRKVFRGKFVAGLKRLRQRDQLWPQRTSGPVR
jgi:hypothetical protein